MWFIGPWRQPGYYLRVSFGDGASGEWPGDSWDRPPGFAWDTMDRNWSACRQPQGTTAMDYGEGWSVLSVADYTVDGRPNVLVAFAVQRDDVPEADMVALAARRYPSVWQRLCVPTTGR